MLFGLVLRILFFLLLIGSLPLAAQDELSRYRFSRPAMGTTFVLTFYASSQDQANQAAEAAFRRVEQLNLIFSDYLQSSEISGLSQKAGQKVPVSDDLWYLLNLSKRISRHSKGAFDITVGPLSRLWRRAIRQQEFPDSSQVDRARQLVNYKWVKLYPATQQVKLKKTGMRLDFGGIAKGYAIDQAYLELKRENINIALVDGGGDLFISRQPPDGSSWSVKNLAGDDIAVDPPVALASSGDHYRFLNWNNQRFSHIINPSDGLGIKNSNTITVMAPSAVIADAMASALSIMGVEKGKKLIRKYELEVLD